LTARLEAKGKSIDVFTYFETGVAELEIIQLCERVKKEVFIFIFIYLYLYLFIRFYIFIHIFMY